MLHGVDRHTWAVFYAATTPLEAAESSYEHYRQWIMSVFCREFADELIVAALASVLDVWICCVPFSPGDDQWAVTHYAGVEGSGNRELGCRRRVVLGNDNVHYVSLLPITDFAALGG
jgi:hypothetical protein